MKISTKGRYALKIIIDLAEHQKDEFIPLRYLKDLAAISITRILKSRMLALNFLF